MAEKAITGLIEPISSANAIGAADNTALTSTHRNAVNALADHLGISIEDVHRLYCIVLARLAKEAKIKDYLPIFVSRRVRYLIQKKIKMRLEADRMNLT